MKRIVILGSGSGGTIAANTLAHRLSNEIKNSQVSLQIIGESEKHVFEPANLDIAFRGSNPKKSIHGEQSLLDKKIQFTPQAATRIDYRDRSVTTEAGVTLNYDYLILATGAVANQEAMAGLKEGSLTFHRSPFEASKIWDKLQTFKGGKVVVAITSVPHKCPPSPNEAAFMLDEFFRRKGIRDSVQIRFLTPYPRAYSAQSVSDVIQPMFEERGIEIVPFFTGDYVDPVAKKIYSMEGEGYEYDLLIAIPPHRGAEVIQASSIGDEEGWIPTDKRTMRVKDQSGVYAIGDATNIPISKSGVVAHLQGGIVPQNIEAEIKGNSEIYEYNGRINCPMETGHRQALFIAGTYDTPPPKQNPTFVRYFMKKTFGRMYWSSLGGRWNWLFDIYFGKTSTLAKRELPLGKEMPIPRA